MPDIGRKELIVAGIMTGNSLDAVDVATFRAGLGRNKVERFEQISFHSEPCSAKLRADVLKLKDGIKTTDGVVTDPLQELFTQTHNRYHLDVNRAVTAARAALVKDQGIDIDVIGFHGQTLGHKPPSVSKGELPYTVQLVDGAAVADTQRVVTIADFRSDDLLNGGEGAPFAPGFNALLTPALGVETAVFINAGNTSNIAIIKKSDVRGWDCGPCNQFPDALMREEKGLTVDEDGKIALTGVVEKDLIEKLWHGAVTKADGSNALEIEGPRSFDPQWYRLPDELKDPSVPFENRLRTVVAFSAYCIAHSLAKAVRDGYRPEISLLFGGGWKNPALLRELKNLCSGKAEYILPQHRELMALLPGAISDPQVSMKISDEVGLPSSGMEAGIFAFAAVQRILDQPFTKPSFTNCRTPTRCGAVFVPQNGQVAPSLADFNLPDDRHRFKDPRLGRAAPDNQ